MASDRPTLKVAPRDERGSRAIRRLRRAGIVPGVLYGGTHRQSVPFKVGFVELRRLLNAGAALVDVDIEGDKKVPAILKDSQYHPVRDDLLHVDFLEVSLTEKIRSPVVIELEGVEDAPGVKEGGVLDQAMWEVEVDALPTDIPERLVLDVSALDMGATLSLADVPVPAGVELVPEAPEEIVVASVVVPTQVEEPEVEEETELVGEEGEAVEGEPAEGEAAGEEAGEAGEDE